MFHLQKAIFFSCAIALITIVSSCMSSPTVSGNGHIQTKNYFQKDFTSVSLGGKWNAEIRQGDVFSIQIDIDENLFEHLDVYVLHKTLHIETKGNVNIRSTQSKASITMPSLIGYKGSGRTNTRIEGFNDEACGLSVLLSGSGEMDAQLAVKKLSVHISGSGSFKLRGQAEDVHASVSGSGKIDAFDFKADNIDIHISGSGTAKVHAEKTLKAQMSGSGSVIYTGKPVVSAHISGSAKIIGKDNVSKN